MQTKKLIGVGILICVLGAVGGYLFESRTFIHRDGWYILGGLKLCIAIIGYLYWKTTAKWVTFLWMAMYGYVILEHLIRYINWEIKQTQASNWISDTGLSPLLFVVTLFVYKLSQVYGKKANSN